MAKSIIYTDGAFCFNELAKQSNYVLKQLKTHTSYKILTWLSIEFDISAFVLSLEGRNVIKVTDKPGSEMLVKYEKREFKTECI